MTNVRRLILNLDDSVTLGFAREWLRNRVDVGEKCPCCGQFAKVYRRKINSGQAHSLIKWWRAAGDDWVHVPTVVGRRSAEEGKLAYWDLVQEAPGKAGRWRITDKGREFVHARLSVPKYAVIYDGRLLGFEGDPVSIYDALSSRFSYPELMNGAP